jgi:hypothetical protein
MFWMVRGDSRQSSAHLVKAGGFIVPMAVLALAVSVAAHSSASWYAEYGCRGSRFALRAWATAGRVCTGSGLISAQREGGRRPECRTP